MERYTSGAGQMLWVHDRATCRVTRGLEKWCVIHARMPGHMQDWPTFWRSDWGGFMEVLCPHGIGHPAPESKETALSVHGCDGCCRLAVGPKMTDTAVPYQVRQGGLMRCCLETLSLVYAEEPEHLSFEGGKVYCRYCSASMVRRDGAWEWDHLLPPVPPAAELA